MATKYTSGIKNDMGFEITAAKPMDYRDIVETYEDLSSLIRYEGMKVFVEADKKNYQMISGNWVEMGSSDNSEKLERLQYYGDSTIVPTDASYFTFTTDSSSKTASIVLEDTVDKPTVTSVVIPYEYIGEDDVVYSVTTIGNDAFYDCTSLKSINIPNSVTTIGTCAFAYCASLKSINIPNSVTTIGNEAFLRCTSLKSINIPNSVTTIGNEAFHDCTSLTSVNIPNSVTTIGTYAFADCTRLKSVNIPNSVTTISTYAFAYCSSLTSVNIPNSVTTIGTYAFQDCSSLTSVNIPNSVTTIGEGAFAYCTSLTSVTIPNSVTTIEEGAFTFFDEEGNDIANPNVTVICEQGSYAETYCIENGIKYVYDTIDLKGNLYTEPTITNDEESTSYMFDFSLKNNEDVRLKKNGITGITFTIPKDYDIPDNYKCGLTIAPQSVIPTVVFDKKDTKLKWFGYNCVDDGELTVFIPETNILYEIGFQYNGFMIIGKVIGYEVEASTTTVDETENTATIEE